MNFLKIFTILTANFLKIFLGEFSDNLDFFVHKLLTFKVLTTFKNRVILKIPNKTREVIKL